ncbi:unnamed protein product [Strongylus vulgaris]|uniref:Uncharacterized protein n=1 Tax=Strongylus vulgaris TaxID=40348 RepID=A0A3P7LEL6_STRVU|nr:unnamed protein product [Strongylus vulgaris]
MYGRLLDVLVRDIKLLTYNNAALVDEVSRLNYAILIASEERKRSCHHDRNRIRRLQTANKRKSDAQKRQQEQLTLAETQENIAQIKAKMAKTIASPQKFDYQLFLINREGNEGPTKRIRCDSERTEFSENATASKECSAPSSVEKPLSLRHSVLSSDAEELVDEQNRRRRGSRPVPIPHESTAEASGSISDVDVKAASVNCSGDTMNESSENNTEGVKHVEEAASLPADPSKDDDPQSWRRRSGRPPARAASAAAQTLLAAELAANEEVSTYSPKKASRSRSNTNESPSARAQKSKRSIVSISASGLELGSGESMTYPTNKELAVDVRNESGTLGSSELDPKDDAPDEDMALSDALGSEDSRGSQRLRPMRRTTRTVCRKFAFLHLRLFPMEFP